MRGAIVMAVALILVVLALQQKQAMAACTTKHSASHCAYILRD